MLSRPSFSFLFFFNDTATTEIYTLSLHDALPILPDVWRDLDMPSGHAYAKAVRTVKTCVGTDFCRSEEHTSGLQSRLHLVCRLLLEKKKKNRVCRIKTDKNQKDDWRRTADDKSNH